MLRLAVHAALALDATISRPSQINTNSERHGRSQVAITAHAETEAETSSCTVYTRLHNSDRARSFVYTHGDMEMVSEQSPRVFIFTLLVLLILLPTCAATAAAAGLL
jgi:hypothetical protein